jgi:aldehyde:ferredoxin oxidoreductase
MCIGPAGEHLVKFASVVTDGHSTGRAGLGAVLGWKQLKAITVESNQPLPLWDEAAAREANRRWYAQLRQLAPETPAGTVCTACPLHCPRHNRGEDSLLDELGMDAFAAKAVAGGCSDPELYRAIARNELPEGAVLPRDKGGKRRGGGDGRIAGAFGLTSDSVEFCKHYTEAVCCLGQCMFTLNGLTPETGAQPLLDLLNAVTGRALTLPDLLTIGARSRKLQRALLSRFE